MIIAHMVLTRCILINSKYNGTVSNATGMSRPIMMTTSNTRRPGNRNLDIAYPQETEISVPTTPDTVEYSNELSTHLGNIPLVQAMRECQLAAQLNSPKANPEVLTRSVLFLVDAMTSQMIGSKK